MVGLVATSPTPAKSEEQAPGVDGSRKDCQWTSLIAKQRNGPAGDVNLTFLKWYHSF